ncbi:MAG: hypothetical protein CM15mP12_5740 [Gammaproteobacteria bacterium]|nr:MAG: hypothetical protein CM15mP12_5740 [Gammaproteobacteria bacterium]
MLKIDLLSWIIKLPLNDISVNQAIQKMTLLQTFTVFLEKGKFMESAIQIGGSMLLNC